MHSVVLYGIGNLVDDRYKVVDNFVVYEDDFSIGTVKYIAQKMIRKMPNIEHIYMIDNSGELYRMFKRSLDSLEDRIVFKDYLERCGIEIPT